MQLSEPSDERPKSRNFLAGRKLRYAINVGIIVVVCFGLWKTVRSALRDLQVKDAAVLLEIQSLRQTARNSSSSNESTDLIRRADQLERERFSFANMQWAWILLAVPCAIVGILAPGLYWFWTLRALHIHVPLPIVARAYYVGNLGKYVPGKAMVMILRATALRPFGATVPMTVISVFVETLTTMAVGAAIGVVAISQINVPPWLSILAWISASLAVLPTLPPIFVPLLKSRLAGESELRRLLPKTYNWSLMLSGWGISVVGWLVLGTGLFCVAQGMPHLHQEDIAAAQTVTSSTATESTLTPPNKNGLKLWIVCVAACSLSVVAGFVSLLPGGAGVRELVLTILLSPIIGTAAALTAAIVHRLATIFGELVLAGLCSAWTRVQKK